jgi:iron complex transport system substrate-binding protein
MVEDLSRVHTNIVASCFRACVCNTVRVHSYVPSRVVSLQPSATVILRDLGKLDALIACTKYCLDVCPEIAQKKVAIVADSWTAQSQQIKDLQPDLVIASVPYQEKAIAEIMKSGSRFLGLAPKVLKDVYGDISMIAALMRAAPEGDALIAKIEHEIATVRDSTAKLARPKVFCEEWGKPLISSQPWVAQLVEAAGGEFFGTPGTQALPEQIAEAAPNVLIAAWCGAGDRVPLEKIVAARGWQDLPAVKNRRVYCIRDEYLNTPAPTLIQGLHALAAAIHPECFPHAQGLRCIHIE